jgi:collagen type I/II/III/V/XI/XXIV/XXVII alpha
MSGLKGQTVATTYEGLIKTSNSAPIDTTPVTLSDGAGNLLPMEVGTQGINWSGDQDFTNATVTGLVVPPGPTGAQGAQGAEGAQGATGAQGDAGAKGDKGEVGATGAQGIAGPQGAQGIAGATGAQGVAGATGPQGAQGIEGAQGAQGDIGVQGDKGDVGATGAQGVAGAQGIEGAQGATGAKGEVGATGAQGAAGISAGATYYFNESESSEITPYKVISTIPSGAQQTILKTLTSNQTGLLVQEFITPELGFAVIPGGTQRFHFHFLKPASNDNIETYVTLQLTDSLGTPVGPVITSGSALIGWVDVSTPAEVTTDLTLPTTIVDPTYRMIVKIYVSNLDSTTHNITWYTQGVQYYSYVLTTVGVVGNKGETGAQGAQGDPGPTGAQGDTGAQGAVGPISSTGPNTINSVWSGTQVQYDALGTYDAATIYFID